MAKKYEIRNRKYSSPIPIRLFYELSSSFAPNLNEDTEWRYFGVRKNICTASQSTYLEQVCIESNLGKIF